MFKLDISNFANLREVHLHDDSQLSLICGYNESGKSSLIGAVEYAFTGSAFGLRGKDVAAELVTHGESGLHVRAVIDGLTVNRTTTAGDAVSGIADKLGVPSPVMPLLLNSTLCGDGGDKAMRVFLDGVASSKFDAAVHFAADPDVSCAVLQAKKSGRQTTKQIIEYAESIRASCKEPSAPAMPLVPNPSDDEIAAAQIAVQSESARLVEATNNYHEYEVNGQIILKIVQHQRDMEAYEKLRALSSITDSLGENRAKLEQLSNVNTKTLDAICLILENLYGTDAYIDAAVNQMAKATDATKVAIGKALTILNTNPSPPSAPRLPIMAPDVLAVYDSLKSDGLTTNDGLASISKAALEGSTAALELKEASRLQSPPSDARSRSSSRTEVPGRTITPLFHSTSQPRPRLPLTGISGTTPPSPSLRPRTSTSTRPATPSAPWSLSSLAMSSKAARSSSTAIPASPSGVSVSGGAVSLRSGA